MIQLPKLDRKGNAVVLNGIITIIFLFILFVIVVFLAKTQSSMKEAVSSIADTVVVNETHDSLVYNTKFLLAQNVSDEFYKTTSITIVTNSTNGNTIASGNYSFDAARGEFTVLNTTADTGKSWNVSYTTTNYQNEGAGRINIKALSGLEDATGDNASAIYLIAVVVIIMGLVLGIIYMFQRLRA